MGKDVLAIDRGDTDVAAAADGVAATVSADEFESGQKSMRANVRLATRVLNTFPKIHSGQKINVG